MSQYCRVWIAVAWSALAHRKQYTIRMVPVVFTYFYVLWANYQRKFCERISIYGLIFNFILLIHILNVPCQYFDLDISYVDGDVF
jgi:hypothetical protein